MSEIPYRPLDTSKSQIRVLRIQPCAWSEDDDWSSDGQDNDVDFGMGDADTDIDQGDIDIVSCNLCVISLDDCPVYEALSYVWGDSSERAEIVVDGVRTMVTVNLQRALRRLRYANEDEVRVVWVDAVCINQQNITERGQQVGMMADIYSSCSRCVVWLGEEEDCPLEPYPMTTDWHSPEDVAALESYIESQGKRYVAPIPNYVSLGADNEYNSWLDVKAALDLAVMIGNGKHLYELPFYQITEFPKFKFCTNWENAWHSLNNIIGERPWWKRTWTIQEAILPEVVIVQLGCHEILFEMLLQAAETFADHSLGCCDGSNRGLWNVFGSVKTSGRLSEALSDLESYTQTRNFHRGISDTQTKNDRRKIMKEYHTLYSQLMVCQGLSQFRSTTDPRDSIYGMLGICPGVLGPNCVPDYNKDTATVYSEASLRLIQGSGILETLDCCSPRREREYLNLPSWVQDWGMEDSSFPSSTDNACGRFTTYESPPVLSKSLVLPINSRKISTVQALGRGMTEETGRRRNITVEILRNWQGLTPVADDIFWGIVFHNYPIERVDQDSPVEFDADEPMMEADYEQVAEWWQLFQSSKWDWHELPEKIRHVSIALDIRCVTDKGGAVYFVTDLGDSGVARNGINVGDEVHIVKGCPSPVILRPLTETIEGVPDEMRPSLFKLVSCCWLNGFMDGVGADGMDDWREIYLR
jgi:hypothetical protein